MTIRRKGNREEKRSTDEIELSAKQSQCQRTEPGF